MEITCKKIEIAAAPKLKDYARVTWWVDKATGLPPVPGDIFYALHFLESQFVSMLADNYWARPEPRRPPIVVVLPDGIWHCVDWACFSGGKQYGGWEVTGELPRITCMPSINVVGLWHGHLQDGVLREC